MKTLPTNESLEETLANGGEPECSQFLINGLCPKSRYLSTDCPFYFGRQTDHLACKMEKEA